VDVTDIGFWLDLTLREEKAGSNAQIHEALTELN
jgi:hypothetical protein